MISDADVAQQMLRSETWTDRPFIANFFRTNQGILGAKRKENEAKSFIQILILSR